MLTAHAQTSPASTSVPTISDNPITTNAPTTAIAPTTMSSPTTTMDPLCNSVDLSVLVNDFAPSPFDVDTTSCQVVTGGSAGGFEMSLISVTEYVLNYFSALTSGQLTFSVSNPESKQADFQVVATDGRTFEGLLRFTFDGQDTVSVNGTLTSS